MSGWLADSGSNLLGVTIGNDSKREEIEGEVVGLYEADARRLRRYARVVAECDCIAQEAVQETFLKYYVHRLHYQAPASPRSWLFRAVYEIVLSIQKLHTSENHVCLSNAARLPDGRPNPEQAAIRADEVARIFALMSPRELQSLQLRAEGFSYKEIGGILGIESGTVGALLARAAAKIEKASQQESQR